MRFLSVCSGIEAASVAWNPLGWKAAAFAEIEPFPCSVLAHHYPDTPNLGDMTKFKEWPDDLAVDLLCGGTPCQSFSVAGLRGGLADPRGDLMLTFGAIAAKYRPKWLVWENVPGVLSSNGGRDFGSFLGLLGELGYGFAYRVLDAQFFGVPQRRRRVFVVGCLGDWRSAAAVLFERHSLSGHPAPSRQAGKKVTPILEAGARTGVSTTDPRAGIGIGESTDPMFTLQAGKQHGVAVETLCVATGQAGAEIGAEIGADMAPTLTCNHEAPYIAHSLRGEGFDASEDGTGRGTPLVVGGCDTYNGAITGDVAATLSSQSGDVVSAGPSAMVPVTLYQDSEYGIGEYDTAGSIRAGREPHHQKLVQPTEHPYTLAIRGRCDSHNLEYRHDGTANALLTPNGGRGGIGVGAIAFDCKASGQNGFGVGEIASTQRAMGHAGSHTNGGGHQAVRVGMQVRRLTPRECERLQGFPDGYLDVLHRGKPAADGNKYKALGNSWAVPVAAWVGRRIEAVEAIQALMKEAA
jgi:DNA (cytosine-5)-methyltransferase 1